MGFIFLPFNIFLASPKDMLIDLREGERKGDREKHRFVVLLIYASIGCFLCVPWSEIEPTTLANLDDTLTH